MAEPTSREAGRTPPWVLWGVVAAGLALTVTGIVSGVGQAIFAAGETRTTEGSVVGHVPVRRDPWRRQRGVLLVIQYQADGHVHEFKSRESYQPWERPIGSQVPVIYRPGRPGSGQIDNFTERWGHVPALCISGPCVALLAALALAHRSRKHRRKLANLFP